MELIYENDYGRVHFQGHSGRKKNGLYIKAVNGLGLPGYECRSITYVNSPGQVVTSCRDLERVITISVDIFSLCNVQEELRRVTKVLYHPGELTVVSGVAQRKIRCRCSDMDNVVRHGRDLISVVWQFVCDYPYFTDKEAQRETIFSKVDLIHDNFTLPCVFSERVARKIIVNQGDLRAEPILSIYNTGMTEVIGEEQENFGIQILNHTTGKRLLLQCRTELGEEIQIHIPERNIMSSVKGNIIADLAQNCFLSEFYLETGCNDIEVISNNRGEELNVMLTYERQYVEAVV